MADLKALKGRIAATKSNAKIFHAQELIATSRITRAQARTAAQAPYTQELVNVLSAVAGATNMTHPLLADRPNPKRAAVLIITSGRGMCGGYNHNVLKAADELCEMLQQHGTEPVLYVMGAKGIAHHSFHNHPLAGQWSGFSMNPEYENLKVPVEHLLDSYLQGSDGTLPAPDGTEIHGCDAIYLVYTTFRSMLSQVPTVRRMIPIEAVYEDDPITLGEDMLSDPAGSDALPPEYEFEPNAEELLDELLPRYITTRVFAASLESAASECAARRTAMKAATDNANELIKDLSRLANTARQAQITQEITEIVGGAGALSESAGRD